MQSDAVKMTEPAIQADGDEHHTQETAVTTETTAELQHDAVSTDVLALGDVAQDFDANSLTATFAIARSPINPAQVMGMVGIKVRGDLVAPGVLDDAQIAALRALLEPWMDAARAGWAKRYQQRAEEQARRKKDESERKARADKAAKSAKEIGERSTKRKADKGDPKKVVAPPPLFDVAEAQRSTAEAEAEADTRAEAGVEVAVMPNPAGLTKSQPVPAPIAEQSIEAEHAARGSSLFDLN